MRKAFTILELMAVVAIMGILLGIVVAAAANSIRLTRTHKTNAIRAVVQQGMETYHSQKDKWPGTLGDVVGNGDSPVSKTNTEGFDGTWNHDIYIMDSPEEVKGTIREVVRECVSQNNPMMDISGLFVSRDRGEKNGHGRGYDFWEAVRGSERTRKKMAVAEMYYGYPESSHGYFRSFRLYYSVPTDSVEVRTR